MSCHRNEFGRAICRDCGKGYNPYWYYINDNEAGASEQDVYTIPQCEDCFEASLETFEEDRRIKIAERNEY